MYMSSLVHHIMCVLSFLVMEQDLDVRVKAALEEIRRTQRTLADKSARPFYQDSLELLSRKYADIHKRYVPRVMIKRCLA